MEQELLLEKRGHIRIITLNRPEVMNAITIQMIKLHEQYLQKLLDDDDAWVIIFTGKGSAFSSGIDFKALKELIEMPRSPRTLNYADTPEFWKPTIAAINGYALGGGCELALACDIRIASDNARIGLPEVKRAVIPGGGGCARLPRVVALGSALMMLLTGDWIDAQEAYRIGLVQKVVPSDRLIYEAVQLGEKICENGPVAVRNVKEALYRGLGMSMQEALAINRLFSMLNSQMAPADIEEGMKSFVEKRKPVYKGH